MENSAQLYENYDLGYQASPSSVDQNDHSTTETSVYSTMSGESFAYRRSYSEISTLSDPIDDNICCSEPSPSNWLPARLGMKQQKTPMDSKLDGQEQRELGHCGFNLFTELEMVKERLSKLLLGEDMSGSGKGVCTAVTISNAITNLYATVFGQNLRLEPLKPEKKAMWKREMDCLLSVCDYIVEFIPESKNLSDGRQVEMMASRPRADIYINLPALRKLDTMLLELLDSFQGMEFWYAEQGSMSSSSTLSGSFHRVVVQRKEEKWWLPVPCVPRGGLSEKSRIHLRHKRHSAKQIHRAAMTINSSILAEMDIPDSFLATLPKSGKACLVDPVYRHMYTTDKFSPDYLLDCLNLSSQHEALELADRVEASMYTWRRKACMSHSKSSWDKLKDLMSDTDRSDKNHILAGRAESLLFCLKQRYPELAQTSLDTCKIQYNRDVGQAILESFSRVLEGLAFNCVAWIEEVLFVDRAVRSQDY